jgi:hypothetical protein
MNQLVVPLRAAYHMLLVCQALAMALIRQGIACVGEMAGL